MWNIDYVFRFDLRSWLILCGRTLWRNLLDSSGIRFSPMFALLKLKFLFPLRPTLLAWILLFKVKRSLPIQFDIRQLRQIVSLVHLRHKITRSVSYYTLLAWILLFKAKRSLPIQFDIPQLRQIVSLVHLRHKITQSVSYYARFPRWLLLSKPPIVLHPLFCLVSVWIFYYVFSVLVN